MGAIIYVLCIPLVKPRTNHLLLYWFESLNNTMHVCRKVVLLQFLMPSKPDPRGTWERCNGSMGEFLFFFSEEMCWIEFPLRNKYNETYFPLPSPMHTHTANEINSLQNSQRQTCRHVNTHMHVKQRERDLYPWMDSQHMHIYKTHTHQFTVSYYGIVLQRCLLIYENGSKKYF